LGATLWFSYPPIRGYPLFTPRPFPRARPPPTAGYSMVKPVHAVGCSASFWPCCSSWFPVGGWLQLFWLISPESHSTVHQTRTFSFQSAVFFRASRPPGIPLQCTNCQSNTAIFLFIPRYHMSCLDAASIYNRISKISWWGLPSVLATLWFGPFVQAAEGHWCGRAGGVRPSGRARGARALKLAGRLPARRSVAKIRSPNFPILNRVRVGH
jgi:hypothetical protein